MKKNCKSHFLTTGKYLKLLKVLKLCLIFLVYNGLSVHASEKLQGKKLNVNYNSESLQNIIIDLEKRVDLVCFYNVKDISAANNISLKLRNVTVHEIFSKALENTGLKYTITNNTVVINKKSKPDNKKNQKKIVIKGKVVDEKGVPLPGAAIKVKGTSIGVATNTKGEFTIELPKIEDVSLVVSFIGMKSKTVKVKGDKKLEIKLIQEKQQVEEVVVTGYANINKKSFSGNSVTIKKEDLMKASPQSIVQALTTFDPSLRISENNLMGSNPNALPEMYLRGKSAIGTTELDAINKTNLKANANLPTFILDGFEVDIEKIFDLDMNRVKNITILKDAAATAIYGSRAANGVIVIQTIAPKSGEIRVSYNLNFSITGADLTDYNLFDAEEKLEAEKKAGLFDAESPNYKYYGLRSYYTKERQLIRGVNSEWITRPLQEAYNHSHSLYIEGGHEDLLFGVDLKYQKNDGVTKGSYRNRKGAGFSITYKKNKLLFKNYMSYTLVNQAESPYGNFDRYTKLNPYNPTVNLDGEYTKRLDIYDFGGVVSPENPLYDANLNSYNKTNYNEFLNNFEVDWYINDHLRFKNTLSARVKTTDRNIFTDPLSAFYVDNVLEFALKAGRKSVFKAEETTFDLSSFLIYNRTINDHNINMSFGINAKESKYEYQSFTLRGFPTSTMDDINFGYEVLGKPSGRTDKVRLLGTFISGNYSLKDTYLLDVSFRTDGSSQFGTEKKYAPFWSTGVGLNIHKYSFLKDKSWVQQIKLRASYGETGKTNFPPHAAKTMYTYVTKEWYPNGVGTVLSAFGNEDLKWEKTQTFDYGAEISLFNGKFNLNISKYRKKTIDLISTITIPSSTGFKTFMGNLGELENKGIDVFFRSNIISTKDTKFNIFCNLNHNDNKLLKISDSFNEYNKQVDDYYKEKNSYVNAYFNKPLFQYHEGSSLYDIYAMKSLGINPADGKEIFLNKDGTPTYDWSASQNVVCGNTEPEVSGTFGFNLYHKRFSVYTAFMYEYGGELYNQTLCDNVEMANIQLNCDKRVLSDRWIKAGDLTPLKDIKDWGTTTMPTSRFIQKNNFVSLKSVSISYDCNPSFAKKIGMSQLRFQFNMEDVFKKSTIKQERGTFYPFARTFNFSINSKF